MSLQNVISNGERISCVDLKEEFNQTSESGKHELTFVDLPGDHHDRQILCLNNNEDVLKLKSDKEVFNCEYCDFMCSKLSDLQNHSPIHLPVIVKNIESYGAEVSPKQDQKIHVCDECGDIFVFTKTKTNQIQLQIYKGDSKDSCDECSNKLIKVGDISSPKDLDAHTEQHDIDKKLLYPNVEEEVLAHDVNDDSGYFENVIVKQENQITIKREKQNVLGKYQDNVNKQMIIKKQKYEASITEKYQIKSDAKYRPYACSKCTFRSVEEETLKKHYRTHFIEKRFACPHCNYKGEKAVNLKNHLKIHSNEKPHGCSKCQYRTNNFPNLKRHERQHTGEKPFQCAECDYMASQKIALQNHIKARHNL